jgi:hypothetical protein
VQGRKDGRGGGASTICFVEELRVCLLGEGLSVDFQSRS